MSEQSMSNYKLVPIAVCFALFLIFGLVFNVATKSEAKGPCHQYETKLMYNAATKTMMTSRVCILRGEWVGDERETSHD